MIVDNLEWRLDKIISLLEEVNKKLSTIEENTDGLDWVTSKIDDVLNVMKEEK